jgi:hypothetical protein
MKPRHQRHQLVALSALVANVACGALADDGGTSTELVETGTAEQAVTYILNAQFGVRDSDSIRCTRPPLAKNYSQTNGCKVPNRRNKGICLEPKRANVSTFQYNAFRAGVEATINTLNGLGYSFGLVSNCANGHVAKAVCYELPAGLYGQTAADGPFPIFGPEIWAINSGSFRVDVCRVLETMQQPDVNANANEVERAIKNAVRHEMGHVAGLGHPSNAIPAGLACADSLMYPFIPSCNKTLRDYTAFEKQMLSEFDVL